jgi:hypothetical protein
VIYSQVEALLVRLGVRKKMHNGFPVSRNYGLLN